MDELTYTEHINGKLSNLRKELEGILRNFNLTKEDLDSKGFLTKSFFEKNKDSIKIKKINSIEKEIKLNEEKINKLK